MLIIIEKTYENYFMSMVWNRTDNNIDNYNEVISFKMNYNFETNSCFNLNNQKNSNELSPLQVGQNETNNKEGIYSIN